jgi:hypothetical protein
VVSSNKTLFIKAHSFTNANIGIILKKQKKIMNFKKLIKGTKIIVYGQKVKIKEVITQHIIYLEHSIIVPSVEYSRDYISSDEIQQIINLKLK